MVLQGLVSVCAVGPRESGISRAELHRLLPGSARTAGESGNVGGFREGAVGLDRTMKELGLQRHLEKAD